MVESTESRQDDAARRAYGVLATGLGEALDEVRAALSEHADLLPAGRLQAFDALLAEFARRRIRVAFYGEVKAGKSTLINAIAGRELSPSAFDPLTTLPIRLTYGAETTWRVGERAVADVDEIASILRGGLQQVAEIVAESPIDLLQLGGQVDLIDTPGVGSDDRADQISADVLRSLDAVVLVVRYPGLFTRLTRTLVNALESDIGKLFVVWNLDADCAELSADERQRHAETLRADVAGAHELHLVDARRALRGRQGGDPTSVRDSGLDQFIAALGYFASSEKRDIAALREAAKRSDAWLAEAESALRKRLDHLRVKLEEVESRLADVRSAAAAEDRAARDQFDHFAQSLDSAEKDRATGIDRCVAYLRKSLRSARRRWARTGQVEPLREAIAAAGRSYAEGAATVARDFSLAIARAAGEFGAEYAVDLPAGEVPLAEPLAPDERIERSLQGRGQWLRRSLWHRWYLPGLAALEGDRIAADIAAAAERASSAREAAVAAMRAVLQERCDAVASRREGELGRIMDETNYEAELAERAGLDEHLPVIESRRAGVAEISRQAWSLK